MAGKKYGDLNAATEAKADDLYAIRQDRGAGVHETRKITAEQIFQWFRGRLGMAARRDVGTDPDEVPLNSDLGSAAYVGTGTFATAAQGGLADTALQPGQARPSDWVPSWGDVTDKPAVIAAGATQAAARNAIGAGTSSLVLGTGASNAKPGNWMPGWVDVTGKPAVIAAGATEAAARTAIGLGTAATRADSFFVKKAGDTGIKGYTSPSKNIGTLTSSVTISPTDGNLQHGTLNGNVTINAPTVAETYTIIVEFTNGASANTVTLAGFDVVDGDDFTSTSGHKFMLFITKTNSAKLAIVKALQ